MRWMLLMALLVIACTKPNPESCADGSCTDPDFPFCDVDGSIGGKANACIAVDCMPDEVAGCRGAAAIKCNTAGNNFDLVECAFGCDATAKTCAMCNTDENCELSAPICDAATKSCRKCTSDDECTSKVCSTDFGTCVAASTISYATPGGSEASGCLLAQPCSIERAILIARQQGTLVRILPGVYATPIQVTTSNVTPFQIIATGATLTSFTGLLVTNGANVVIRGLESTGANFALQCGESGMLRSKVSFSDGALIAGTSSSNLAAISNCDVVMRNVEFRVNDSTGSGLLMSTDTTFDGDRLHFHGTQQPSIGTFGSRVSLRITNSLIENPLILLSTSDTSPPGSAVSFGFNTIIMNTTPLDCSPNSGAPFRVTLFENNIMVAPGNPATVSGTTCTLVNNVMLPQPGAPAGNVVADPQFVNISTRDFHVKSTSPAVGAALAAPMIFSDHDHDGRARPTGNASDIGAFEQ